jgi:hypothetical protein
MRAQVTGTVRRGRAAMHAAAGAPRLYRAARDAGAGRGDAVTILLLSAVVLFVVAPRAAGVPGRQNAVRHFVWQALLTARHGEQVARALADTQERGSTDPADSAADRHNNDVAQAYGAANARALRDCSTTAALRALLQAGLRLWDGGELATTAAPGAARAGRRRRGSPGRARPRRRS